MKSDDPRVKATGIAAGMSGSPAYIDGKLVGALSYGWSFSKEAVAGITPIEEMLEERRRPNRLLRSGTLDVGAGVAGCVRNAPGMRRSPCNNRRWSGRWGSCPRLLGPGLGL